MTLCIKTRGHCICQPDEGVFCPDYNPDWYVQCLMDAINELRANAVPEGEQTDAERYRALRDSGIAVSAWQDADGTHWAVNGIEYMNLDDSVDVLRKR